MTENKQSWEESVEMLIGSLEVGDKIEFEYKNRQRNTSRKTGIIQEIHDQRFIDQILLDVDGAKHPWKIGRSITVTYDHSRDGEQTKHLGRVQRVRSLGTESVRDRDEVSR